jgi:hypothetical protein
MWFQVIVGESVSSICNSVTQNLLPNNNRYNNNVQNTHNRNRKINKKENVNK